ncbi:AraC family transcriptional regulator [Paenibacillus sp. HB172176]|uniref:AraC family transcriptional regulator n=1 Tax=Paenibacillus sp. HB172176 TaxID=2493690 RepID=UPI001438A15E|nr:AraC family transcriptional regulator [Paenibacillus sp. HB172176]
MNKDLLKENRVHGSLSYPLSFYAITCPADTPLLDLHWHEELELLLLTEGKARFRVDSAEYDLAAGEAIFINTGELHAGEKLGEQPCSFVAIVLHPQMFKSSAVDLIHDQYIIPLLQKKYQVPVHLNGERGSEVTGLLRELIALNEEKPPAFELLAKGLLSIAIAKLLQLGEPAEQANKADAGTYNIERLKTVLTYIEAHYKEPIALAQLAKLLAMSESYFCRFFKSMTKESPVAYMNAYRLQKAAYLLLTSNKNVMEVALDTGFKHMSYFNTVFKQRYGCSPSAYRSKL